MRAAHHGHLGCALALLEAGAFPDAQHDVSGVTALMMACEKGLSCMVGALLRARAQVDVVAQRGTRTGWTALMVACAAGHLGQSAQIPSP